jgi:hypothetical protein
MGIIVKIKKAPLLKRNSSPLYKERVPFVKEKSEKILERWNNGILE